MPKLSENYYQIILHTFSDFMLINHVKLSNNADISRKLLPNNSNFFESSYRIILTLSEDYYQMIVNIFFRIYIDQC